MIVYIGLWCCFMPTSHLWSSTQCFTLCVYCGW